MSEAPMHRLELIFIDGNFWQLRLRKEDPRGEILVQCIPGLQTGVASNVEWSDISPEQVQNVRDKLVLAMSLTGRVPGSLSNETMPCRQRGQGIEPSGVLAVFEELFVQQRYKAHCVQNSCSQPGFL